jgi:hypothetical protein
MDFSTIREVGSAFLIGVTVLAVIEATLYIGVGWSPTGLLSELFHTPQSTGGGDHPRKEVSGGRLAVYVVCATVLGLLAEMAFQPLMNDAMGPLRVLPDLVHRACGGVLGSAYRCPQGARSRQDLRLRAVYSIDRDSNRPVPARLLGELITDHLLDKCYAGVDKANTVSQVTTADATAAAQQAWWNSSSQADNAPDTAHPLRECLLEMFYTAENWDYMHPELYEELKNIEARIDFASALWLVTISLLPWAVMLILCSFAIRAWKAKNKIEISKGSLAKRLITGVKRGSCVVLACGLGIAGLLIMGWMDGVLFGGAERAVVMSYVLAVVGVVAALGLLIAVSRAGERQLLPLGSSIMLSVIMFSALIALHLLGYYSYARETQAYAMRAYGYFATYKSLSITESCGQTATKVSAAGIGKSQEPSLGQGSVR